MLKIAYVSMAVLVYGLVIIGASASFTLTDPAARVQFGIFAALAALATLPFTRAAIRAVRKQPIDDRPLMMWVWFTAGIENFYRYGRHHGKTELAFAIFLTLAGIVTLISYIRNPKTPEPEREKLKAPIPQELSASRSSDSGFGCTTVLGFMILVAAPVSQFFMRQRSMTLLVLVAGIGAILMVTGLFFERKKAA